MGDKFPFFYYDILARIFPGGVLLFVLWTYGHGVTNVWGAVQKDTPTAIDSVILAAILAGLSYAVGLVGEAIYQIFPFRYIMERIYDGAFRVAIHNYELNPDPIKVEIGAQSQTSTMEQIQPPLGPHFLNLAAAPTPLTLATAPIQSTLATAPTRLTIATQNQQPKLTDTRRYCWDWLEQGNFPAREAIFPHAHRFQAESKMFQHVTLILLGVGIYETCRGHANGWTTSILTNWCCFLAALGAFVISMLRERRRWHQVIISLDTQQSSDTSAARLVTFVRPIKRRPLNLFLRVWAFLN
jgi:hypothetical protein